MANPQDNQRRDARKFAHPWRIVIVSVILLAVINLGVLILLETDTTREGRTFPVAIDTVSPRPGEILQDAITADLRSDLTGVLVIDGAEVPEDQTDREVNLGEVTFRPGPGKDILRFTPGQHTVSILYWTDGTDRPRHPGAYSWTFLAVA